ncbi:hypothetical protein LSH36_304g02053 [Paralvinella palmiformis]|uniref:P53 and DNA damage-regulated protein 1 n=1 Tax=Paralvinella palmiformis TaxID=53620 RepID=A0AAD9N3R9_9ANNE|nr:hypothetical protein LSH36_304g02053 [Paralvinella palmiformis]
MEQPPEKVIETITAIEEMAEDVLADRRQMIELDRKRQKMREAASFNFSFSRSLRKDKTKQKKWVCFGNMFVKLSKQQTVCLVDKEFDSLDEEICNIRTGIRAKVNKLRDSESKEEIRGFHLQALTKDELESLEAVL